MSFKLTAVFFTLILAILGDSTVSGQLTKVPPALEPWQDWVNATVEHRDCPRVFNDHQQAVCFWPSKLIVNAESNGAVWQQQVTVYEQSWFPIPGDLQLWPIEVLVDGKAAIVLGREGRPCVELKAGQHVVEGRLRWIQMPQKLKIPSETGVLALSVAGEARPLTSWSSDGDIWLRRVQGTTEDIDRLGTQVYRLIEDGIPVWLRTEVELTVSGKSREEELGWVLPEGWSVASVESSIPVAIDELGRLKAQVRAGKWSIVINAFSTSDPRQINFVESAEPIDLQELVGLKQDTSFRVSLIQGLASIDVSQTTFPDRWRGVPVYQWDTAAPLLFTEKQRGMGEKGREGLQISRQLWLDDDGRAFTYEDQVKGKMQQIWRLDADSSAELGSVRINGESQLITASPDGQASGVELRQRNLDLTAIGRGVVDESIQATGWQADAQSLSLTLTVPPGWRVLAVLGADRVSGDWMTTWSLLDLFLLMIFSLAVLRLYGWIPGVVALLAFGLSFHEYGSPRWTWFCLLIPLALSKVVRSDLGKSWLTRIRFLAALLLFSFLIPFVAHQLQSVLYPQLEVSGVTYGYRDFLAWMGDAPQSQHELSTSYTSPRQSLSKSMNRVQQVKGKMLQQQFDSSANLLFDPKSKIQTGPARPAWSWNRVVCSWNGPVTSTDQIHPILLSLNQNRILTLIRVFLLSVLAMFFLSGGATFKLPLSKRSIASMIALVCALTLTNQANAQQPNNDSVAIDPQQTLNENAVLSLPQSAIPSQALLSELRDRLNQVPSAFPHTAELAEVKLELKSTRLTMNLKYHTSEKVAVPVPGSFPDWSPVSIEFADKKPAIVTRRGDHLWILLSPGIHEVIVLGQVPEQSDWEWDFQLKPKSVSIDAPGWTVSGLSREGIPGDQLLFTQDQPIDEDTAAYDQVRSDPIVLVDRYLEIGLVSKVKTVVTRLGNASKAIAMQVPLIGGEAVLTPNREVASGQVSVRMGPQQNRFEWVSELSHESSLQLTATPSKQFVERWSLQSSPIWNVAISGLQPVFDSDSEDLVPVWRPWGGESVSLTLSRPVGIVGESVTITAVDHTVNVGARQRVTTLQIQLECSLSSDLNLELPSDSSITTITMNGSELPQQRDGENLLIPVSPGQHQLVISWSRNLSLSYQIVGESLGLPIDAANVKSRITMPDNRWVLWASGPLRGPAVRFWTILMVALILALFLGGLPTSPLGRWEWMLLVIGLTQVNLFAGMAVVGWLFALEHRGKNDGSLMGSFRFNVQQIGLVVLTIVAITVLIFVVAAGLLGYPEMFIQGNNSTRTSLQWFTPRSGNTLPVPTVLSVSVWIYRVLMLCWALWLASALLRWLTRGWVNFTIGGVWKSFFTSKNNGVSKTVDSSVQPVETDQVPIDAELVDGGPGVDDSQTSK